MKLFLVALLAVVASGHSHVEGEEKDDHLRCAAHEKTQQLLEKNEEYRMKHEATIKHAHEYVDIMKNSEDHSFRQNVRRFKQNNEKDSLLDSVRPKTISFEEKRRLYSTYDDEIDNEPVILIPIIYHVLYSNERGNLSDAQLDSQINVLNKDFRALNDEILDGEVANIWSDRVGDSKIEFYKNATYRVQIESDEICYQNESFKNSSKGGSDAVNPKYFLNVWICNITSAGLLGYAYQPCLLDTTSEWMDGLVLGVDNVGSYKDDPNGTFWFPNGTTYNEGRTATHEIGHYLALDHIWGTSDEDTCSDSDDISDTPDSKGANYGCPDNTTNSCTETDPETGTDLRDMYENYMDYSNDECMYIFTEEQVWRMRSVVSGNGCRQEMYYQGAQINANQTLMPLGERTGSTTYSCNDGCILSQDWVNDNYCDCSECEDEENWTCNSCGGCPTECNTAIECAANCILNFATKVIIVGIVSTLLTHVA